MVDETGIDAGPDDATRSSRVPILIGVGVLALVLVAGAAVAAVRLLLPSSVNPAERLPDSAVFYAEVNLDPRSQTANLLRLLERFDAVDDVSDAETAVADLLEELDLGDVDPDDITGWLGTRWAVAAWADGSAEQFTLAVALASRDDDAARQGLAEIVEATPEEFGYVVEDGLAVLTFADADPQDRLEQLLADGRTASLADSTSFQSALESLGGDQLAVMWINLAEVTTITDDFIAAAGAPGDIDVGALYGFYDAESAVLGIQATDAGLELRYHSGGALEDFTGRPDWLAELGDLRLSQVAGMLNLPDNLDELTEPIFAGFEDLSFTEALDELSTGVWDYELALTDPELDEYDELYTRWEFGTLAETDPDFDRLVELDERYWTFGLQGDYDEWIASGRTDEEWLLEHALTDEEYGELLELEALFITEELTDELAERYFELDTRLYAFGLASGFGLEEIPFDPFEVIQEIYALASGATFTIALGDLFGEPEYGLAIELASGPADQVLDLPVPGMDELVTELGDELVFDGNTMVLGDLAGSGETLADHPRFGDAFADAPEQAIFAVFVDVAALYTSAEDPDEWFEPIQVVSMVQGTDGSGVLRVLID